LSGKKIVKIIIAVLSVLLTATQAANDEVNKRKNE